MSKLRTLAGVLLPLVLILAALPATAAELAASGTTLTVPWGDLVAQGSRIAFEILAPTITAALGLAVAQLFPALRLVITNAFIDRMVRLAADYALNAVEGAAKGKRLDVDVGAAVVAEGVARAVNSTVPWVIEKAGGTQGIAERLFRHLDLAPEASIENVLAPALARVGAPV